ncbi:MAG: tRNA (guanosine(37)-N1)-methyltransferase TrmD [Planctomycetia bacterium]
MRATVVTLLPEMFRPLLETGVIGRGVERGLLRVDLVDLRDLGEGPHRVVDDRPFGGGPGMVLLAEPFVQAAEKARAGHPPGARTLLLTPQGRRFDQAFARELATHAPGFVLLCARYEGVDERAVEHLAPEEVSLGDFVLSGGEPAALAILDAVGRLVPGVLGDEQSPLADSFGEGRGWLDHAHYTRPAVWRGRPVPEVLRGGNHAAIQLWREQQARERTAQRRPDLLGGRGAGA